MINNRNKLYWGLQISGWSAYALLQIMFSVLASEQGFSWSRGLFFLAEALLCLLVTHSYRELLKRRNWIELTIPQLLPRLIGAWVLMALVVYFLRIPISLITGRQGVLDTAFDIEQIAGLSSIYVILIFLWSVFYFIYHYIAQYNKSLKYEASMVEIELNNLKKQLNPHFIFNALNSIRALVDENPAKSKQAINQLSNILRNSLTFEKKGLTKFDDELKVVMDYLSLESVRFEERLRTDIQIDPRSSSFLVPPFMIQTIVENGIKHGVSKLTKGGTIQLVTLVEDNRLRIQIRNSGQVIQLPRKGKSKGTGIANTIQRLKLLYGDRASFMINNEKNNFVLTEIILPKT